MDEAKSSGLKLGVKDDISRVNDKTKPLDPEGHGSIMDFHFDRELFRKNRRKLLPKI